MRAPVVIHLAHKEKREMRYSISCVDQSRLKIYACHRKGGAEKRDCNAKVVAPIGYGKIVSILLKALKFQTSFISPAIMP